MPTLTLMRYFCTCFWPPTPCLTLMGLCFVPVFCNSALSMGGDALKREINITKMYNVDQRGSYLILKGIYSFGRLETSPHCDSFPHEQLHTCANPSFNLHLAVVIYKFYT